MQNFTYSDMLELAQSYATRSDAAFTAKFPTFVALAENRVATDLKQQGFQTPVTGTLPLDGIMAKPAYWRETISFSYTDSNGAKQPILLRSYEYCRNYAPNSTTTGSPKFYADYNASNFLIVPSPPSAYEFELVYYARLEPLSDSNQTNWMTANIPQALFAAIMLEASSWRGNQEGVSKWAQEYQNHKQSILGENMERLADRNLVVTKG